MHVSTVDRAVNNRTFIDIIKIKASVKYFRMEFPCFIASK